MRLSNELTFFRLALQCQLPEYFVHGLVKVDGSIANFNCNADYNLLGNSTVACVNSSWNDTFPICSGKLCSLFLCVA